jgi:hypothetical protein
MNLAISSVATSIACDRTVRQRRNTCVADPSTTASSSSLLGREIRASVTAVAAQVAGNGATQHR